MTMRTLPAAVLATMALVGCGGSTGATTTTGGGPTTTSTTGASGGGASMTARAEKAFEAIGFKPGEVTGITCTSSGHCRGEATGHVEGGSTFKTPVSVDLGK